MRMGTSEKGTRHPYGIGFDGRDFPLPGRVRIGPFGFAFKIQGMLCREHQRLVEIYSNEVRAFSEAVQNLWSA